MNTDQLIIIKGEDKTFEVAKWDHDRRRGVVYILYSTGKFYSYSVKDIKIYKKPCNVAVFGKCIYYSGTIKHNVETVQFFGRYCRLIYQNGQTELLLKKHVKIVESALDDQISLKCFQYLKEIADAVGLCDENERNILATHYDKIDFVNKESVLASFLSGTRHKDKTIGQRKQIIYPFGFNISQSKAVNNAMESDISIIEGPPGTGKTQTILNIIANAIIRGESVAVVSGNNSAIENVYEKLKKYDVGFIVAQLGNVENKIKFVEQQSTRIPDLSQWKDKPNVTVMPFLFDNIIEKLKLKNELFAKYAEEDALAKEKLHFDDYMKTLGIKSNCVRFSKKVTAEQILRFSEEYEFISTHKSRIGFFRRMALRLSYKLKKLKFNSNLQTVSACCQKLFYEKRLQEIATDRSVIENKLRDFDIAKQETNYVDLSMKCFKNALYQKYNGAERHKYNLATIKAFSEKFVDDYPVVLSTTYSLSNALSPYWCYDYVIIDEASQVDIATGALALSCAKKAVIVGDLKQLPNVVDKAHKIITNKIFAKYDLPKEYNYCDNSLLSAMMGLFPDAPKVLLREHYRCHPEIIGFCNQMFYNNELIVMTERKSSRPPLMVYKTVAGNVARGHLNQRQIDVIKNEVFPQQQLDMWDKSVGIVTPYRDQANCLQKEFVGTTVKADTVDKFQGQERSVIILSTVDNEIGEFASNPNRLNVAVSRAMDQFIVVTDGNENDNVSPIHELIEYIHYHNHGIVNSKINSVFDCLYAVNSQAREKILQKYGRKSEFDSENLILAVIKDILEEKRFSHFDVVMHVPFRMLLGDLSSLNKREFEFATNHWTHVDFLIYSKLSHLPILVIEVDGFAYHNATKQRERDSIKDKILTEFGIPILRLNTIGSNEQEKIREKLSELTIRF